jgi:uncharacterized membrane protein YbaN (DUF454 family)
MLSMIKPARRQSETETTSGINRLPTEVDAVEPTTPQPTRPLPTVSGMRRVCYLVGAGLFFTLGVLGALLPGLPATPFLLLTSFFLLRTSPKLNAALLRSRLFGSILRDWQESGGIRRYTKLKAVIFVILAISLTITFSSLSIWPKVAISLLACIGISVIVKLPTAD